MGLMMERINKFISDFLNKEAEAWTKSELKNLDLFNQAVRELYNMGTDDMDEAFGIFEEDELKDESDPMTYTPRHLFKLSSYKNKSYGDLWVAYCSVKNPNGRKAGILNAYIVSKIKGDLKVIGLMSVALDEMNMEPSHWKPSVYNPEDLDINNLGDFVATERYQEPKDDGFSMEDYLANK